jgi:CheY-like chemotaxis protein
MTPAKVLIIDDAETVRRSVAEALEPAGYTVLTATDGFRGIGLLKETQDLCLVIIDLNMPGMSGFGVLEWMRKDAWLVKPCKPEQLRAVVRRLSAKHAP